MVLLLLAVGFFALIGYAIDIKTGVQKMQKGESLTSDESWDMWTGIATVLFCLIVAIWASNVG